MTRIRSRRRARWLPAEDFILREKITTSTTRIPERVVHARGAGAHGHFQVYKSLAQYTTAKFLQDPAVKTPSSFASPPSPAPALIRSARDVRGFAVKFYTEEGNYDLVGNNIPSSSYRRVKFPDLITRSSLSPTTRSHRRPPRTTRSGTSSP